MECKQPHYFFIIFGWDSWGILTVIPCERMIKGNSIIAKVMPDHYMIPLCCQSLQEHLEVASSCFAKLENLNEQVTGFKPEMINLPTKILLVIKPMRTQFKFTHRLICTPKYIYTLEYIYTRVFFAHANWTLVIVLNLAFDCRTCILC